MTCRSASSLPSFARLSVAEKRLIDRNIDVLRLPDGYSLLTAPGYATEMLLLIEGTVAALDSPDRVHSPGVILGAGALLTAQAPDTGFRTRGPATIGVISRGQARSLMTGSAAFATAVAVSLAEELLRRRTTACPRAATR